MIRYIVQRIKFEKLIISILDSVDLGLDQASNTPINLSTAGTEHYVFLVN